MPAKPTPITRLSQTEREALRSILRDLKKVETARTAIHQAERQIEDAFPLAAQVVRSNGGRVRVGKVLLTLSPAQRLIYSAEVQDLEDHIASLQRQLSERKQAEERDGTARPETAAPQLQIENVA